MTQEISTAMTKLQYYYSWGLLNSFLSNFDRFSISVLTRWNYSLLFQANWFTGLQLLTWSLILKLYNIQFLYCIRIEHNLLYQDWANMNLDRLNHCLLPGRLQFLYQNRQGILYQNLATLFFISELFRPPFISKLFRIFYIRVSQTLSFISKLSRLYLL